MSTHRLRSLWTVAALAAAASPAWADPAPDLAADLAADLASLRAQVQAQQAEIQRLHAAQSGGDSWLDQRRAEEVKALVRDVLADADLRASLQGGSANAGYNRGFFIASEDGNNLLRFNATIQARYLYNHRDEAPASGDIDEDENGFQLRRTQLNFQGHVLEPRWTYRVRLAADADGGTLRPDWAWIGYKLTDDLQVQVGQLKPPFLREELIGAPQQLTVERSYTADYFTADFSQGALLSWWRDRLQVSAAVHDGSYAWRTEFNGDQTDVALTGRVDYLLHGDIAVIRQRGWPQLNDFTTWAGEQPAVLLGAAVDYELGEDGAGVNAPDILKWTADVSAEFSPFNFFAAVTGQHFNHEGNSVATNGANVGNLGNLDDANQLGLVAQAGLFVIPDTLEFFGRYEWLDFDGVYYRPNGGAVQGGSRNLSDDELNIVTVGANYYLRKHNAKITVDVLYALDAVPVANPGQGLLAAPEGDQVVLRSQLILNF